ncbi:MAG: hypothetical protein ABIB43_02325 [archaeon]
MSDIAETLQKMIVESRPFRPCDLINLLGINPEKNILSKIPEGYIVPEQDLPKDHLGNSLEYVFMKNGTPELVLFSKNYLKTSIATYTHYRPLQVYYPSN